MWIKKNLRQMILALSSVLIALASAEMAARIHAALIPDQIYKPYSTRSETRHYFYAPQSAEPVRFHFNSAGARGEWDRGQKLRIAVVGSSTAFGEGVTQEKFWPRRLVEALGVDAHIESFGRDSLVDSEIVELVDVILRRKRPYDLVIILYSFGGGHANPDIFRFSDRYKSEDVFLLPDLFEQWQKLNFTSSRIGQLLKGVSFDFVPQARAERKLRNLPVVDFYHDHKARQSASIQLGSSDPRVKFDDRRKAWISMIELKRIARDRGVKLVIAPQFMAYSPRMSPELKPKILSSYSMMLEISPGVFASPENIYEKIRNRGKMTMELAESEGIYAFDWTPQLERYLRTEGDLFVDEVHLGPRGSEIFARDLAQSIRAWL